MANDIKDLDLDFVSLYPSVTDTVYNHSPDVKFIPLYPNTYDVIYNFMKEKYESLTKSTQEYRLIGPPNNNESDESIREASNFILKILNIHIQKLKNQNDIKEFIFDILVVGILDNSKIYDIMHRKLVRLPSEVSTDGIYSWCMEQVKSLSDGKLAFNTMNAHCGGNEDYHDEEETIRTAELEELFMPSLVKDGIIESLVKSSAKV